VGDPLCNYLPLSGDGARRPIKTKFFAQEWHMSCQSAAGFNTPAVTASTAHKRRTHAAENHTLKIIWLLTPEMYTHRGNIMCSSSKLFILLLLYMAWQPPGGPGTPNSRGFQITHNDVPQSVGLLWTSDQFVAEAYTWQHTTVTTDKHPCPRWDWNPHSQQARGRRHTPWTTRTLGPASTNL
jgi:hypothetical protein